MGPNQITLVELKSGKFCPCLSDHCPLEIKIKMNIDRRNETTNLVEMEEIPPRCKWDPSIKTSFLEALKSDKMKQVFEIDLQRDNLSPENGISELSSALLECAGCDSSPPDNKKGSKSKRKINNDQPWFDKECKLTKKKINALGK